MDTKEIAALLLPCVEFYLLEPEGDDSCLAWSTVAKAIAFDYFQNASECNIFHFCIHIISQSIVLKDA